MAYALLLAYEGRDDGLEGGDGVGATEDVLVEEPLARWREEVVF